MLTYADVSRFDSLLKLMRASNLPCSFRTRCCRLLRALYVDRDPFVPLLAPFTIHVWSGLRQVGTLVLSLLALLVQKYKY